MSSVLRCDFCGTISGPIDGVAMPDDWHAFAIVGELEHACAPCGVAVVSLIQQAREALRKARAVQAVADDVIDRVVP